MPVQWNLVAVRQAETQHHSARGRRVAMEHGDLGAGWKSGGREIAPRQRAGAAGGHLHWFGWHRRGQRWSGVGRIERNARLAVDLVPDGDIVAAIARFALRRVV